MLFPPKVEDQVIMQGKKEMSSQDHTRKWLVKPYWEVPGLDAWAYSKVSDILNGLSLTRLILELQSTYFNGRNFAQLVL